MPHYIVIDGILLRVSSWQPDGMRFNSTSVKSGQWSWHISEVDRVLDINKEDIDF